MADLPYGNPLPPDFEDGKELSAEAFNAVKNYWVTDELPEEGPNGEDIVDGDVVFVIGDSPVGDSGLEGLGDWSILNDVEGNPYRYEFDVNNVTWVGYEWRGTTVDTAGSIDLEEGIVDMTLVGGGGCGGSDGWPGADQRGHGGGCVSGLRATTKGVKNLIAGGAVKGNRVAGGESSCDILVEKGAGGTWGNTSVGSQGVGDPGPGLQSDILGQTVRVLGQGGGDKILAPDRNAQAPTTHPGLGSTMIQRDPNQIDGGGGNWIPQGDALNISHPGPGSVIVSVPLDFDNVPSAKWTTGTSYFAVVEDGVVSEIVAEYVYGNGSRTVLPKKELVECHPGVAVGWSFDGSDFTPPSSSREISAEEWKAIIKINELQQELRSYDV